MRILPQGEALDEVCLGITFVSLDNPSVDRRGAVVVLYHGRRIIHSILLKNSCPRDAGVFLWGMVNSAPGKRRDSNVFPRLTGRCEHS